jgi:hypothetical protein
MKKTVFFLLAALAGAAAYGAQSSYSYVDLAKRLTDLEYLATIPEPGDQCAQWSSYDRKSRYDVPTGKYLGWDANGDGDGFIRKEGGQLVLAEMRGPGCIWRIWSAAPKDGHVRIYLDGDSEPAVDLPFSGYFDGKNAPFTRSALVHTAAQGCNNYVPIPYQKSCKIVADPGWGMYFHFGYETFPKGTKVPTFKRQLSAKENAALDEANDVLSNCGPLPTGGATLGFRGQTVVAPGAAGKLASLDGPAAIASLQIKLDLPGGTNDIDVLRSLVLQIRWDGEAEPSVWAPFGDFFGTAPGANPYRSLPLGLTKDGWWYCNWYMPFLKNAEVTLKNEGKAAVKADYKIVTRPLREDAKLARFHAKWHRDALLPEAPERAIDWPFLKTDGAGRFVGVMLHIWNPRGGWWGEGDEKFFVDGEKFPSTFGTGSEDYFGYAWCNPAPFENAYHDQTHNDGHNRGHISVNRWHISDNVPFQQSFEGDIEKYYPNRRPTLYAATAYWYLAPGGKDPYTAGPLSERVGYWVPVEPFTVKGAIEGEKLKVLRKTGGKSQEQEMIGFPGQWSNDVHLWWTDAKPGDMLDLALPVERAAKYRISLQVTKAPDYAIVQFYLDGEKLGGPVDLYNATVVPSGPLVMGARKLEAGDHKLTAEILGSNEKAVKAYMFALDYVKLDAEP